MKVWEHRLYKEDIQRIMALNLPWDQFREKTVLISGGTGLIGSVLVDTLMQLNRERGLDCHVAVIGRNRKKAEERFPDYMDSPLFRFICQDVNQPMEHYNAGEIDYILHLASNTHPAAYSGDPIGTIMSNVTGTRNLLELACGHHTKRFLFASSVEVYGENRGDQERFDETYCGYIDCNTLRAGYPESKRTGEALCQAYRRQKNLNVVIPRLPRTYGPTLLKTDTKALSQFLQKGVEGKNIVLKSAGTQYYSYCYAADTVSGILFCLLKGADGEAYNIADEASDIHLKDLAGMIAEIAGTKVVFELPDEAEQAGYSRATTALMSYQKLAGLGWKAGYEIRSGLERTLKVLKDSQ